MVKTATKVQIQECLNREGLSLRVLRNTQLKISLKKAWVSIINTKPKNTP